MRTIWFEVLSMPWWREKIGGIPSPAISFFPPPGRSVTFCSGGKHPRLSRMSAPKRPSLLSSSICLSVRHPRIPPRPSRAHLSFTKVTPDIWCVCCSYLLPFYWPFPLFLSTGPSLSTSFSLSLASLPPTPHSHTDAAHIILTSHRTCRGWREYPRTPHRVVARILAHNDFLFKSLLAHIFSSLTRKREPDAPLSPIVRATVLLISGN